MAAPARRTPAPVRSLRSKSRAQSQTPAPRESLLAPVPAVSTKQSFEYGAAGKATLSTQIAQRDNNFDDAFGDLRQNARTRAKDRAVENNGAVNQRNKAVRSAKAAAAAAAAVIDEEHEGGSVEPETHARPDDSSDESPEEEIPEPPRFRPKPQSEDPNTAWNGRSPSRNIDVRLPPPHFPNRALGNLRPSTGVADGANYGGSAQNVNYRRPQADLLRLRQKPPTHSAQTAQNARAPPAPQAAQQAQQARKSQEPQAGHATQAAQGPPFRGPIAARGFYARLPANSEILTLIASAFALAFVIIGLLTASVLLVYFMPLPSTIGFRRDNVKTVLKNMWGYELVPDAEWHSQSNINRRMLGLAERNKESFDSIHDRIAVAELALNDINALLPDTVAIRRVNGEIELPDEFWNAVHHRLAADQDDAHWQKFLEQNRADIESTVVGLVRHSIGQEVISEDLATRQEVSEALQESTRSVLAQVSEMMNTTKADAFGRVAAMARSIVIDMNDQLPKSSREAAMVANSHILHNINRVMRERNYFSTGHGAVIDPRLTSSTTVAAFSRNVSSTWLYSWFSTHIEATKPNPPSAALFRWDEATDCWCAKPSQQIHGAAQLSIFTGEKIFARSLIIEHVPKEGTRDIGAAPQSWELFADMGSEVAALDVQKRIDDGPLNPILSDPPKFPPPGKSFVRIARGFYEINHPFWVQKKDVAISTPHLDVSSDRFVFRAVDNWGADHTCLYRLRLTAWDEEKYGPAAEDE